MNLKSIFNSVKESFDRKIGGFTLFESGYENVLDQAVRKYTEVNATLNETIKIERTPHDPYQLLSLLTANGYHERAIRTKVAATVGQGYTGSAALLAHIKQANGEYSMQQLLRRWAFDVELGGNGYVRMEEGLKTAALYHEPAIKVRVKNDKKTDTRSYLRFEYEYGSGQLGWIEYDEYEKGIGSGVKHYKSISPSGNKFYGEPDYTSIKPLLLLNSTIVDSALRFYKHALQSDMAMIMRGGRYKDEELKKIREYMQKSVTGIENARKMIFLKVGPNEDVRFEKLNAELQDSASGKVRNDNRDEIATGHGVFPRLLGIVTAGSLGGPGELEAQLKAFKLLYADERQRDYEEWWQDLFAEYGFPDPGSFKLNPMDIATGTTDAQTLATLVGIGALQPSEARSEWLSEKSAENMLRSMAQLRKAMEYGE